MTNVTYDKKAWKKWVEAETDKLVQLYIETYESRDVFATQHAIIKAGVRSRLDNKYSTAEKKAAVIANPPELTLADLLPQRGSASEKVNLVHKAVELGLDHDIAKTMSAKQLKAICDTLS